MLFGFWRYSFWNIMCGDLSMLEFTRIIYTLFIYFFGGFPWSFMLGWGQEVKPVGSRVRAVPFRCLVYCWGSRNCTRPSQRWVDNHIVCNWMQFRSYCLCALIPNGGAVQWYTGSWRVVEADKQLSAGVFYSMQESLVFAPLNTMSLT